MKICLPLTFFRQRRADTAHPLRTPVLNALLLAFAPLGALPATGWGGVVINEIVASNGSILADEDGHYEDWIELYNAADQATSLAGFGLSDTPDEPFRWVFPEIDLGPGEFLLVWASGKDRRAPDAELHANFSLSADGESLVLTRPDSSAADAVGPVRLDRDQSYGRAPDGTGGWFFFADPTPSAPNTATPYDAWLSPPAFSHAGGFYSGAFFLNLSTHEPGATIFYTLDSSEPLPDAIGGAAYSYKNAYPGLNSATTGPLLADQIETLAYTGALHLRDRSSEPNRWSRFSSTAESYPPNYLPGPSTPIFKGTVVRARTIRDGALPSEIVTHTYFITPQGADRYPLPVVSVVLPPERLFGYEHGIYTAGAAYDAWWLENPNQRDRALWQRPGNYTGRGDEWEAPGHLEYFVSGEGRALAQDVGFRAHGGASRTLPQKSLRLYARRDYDERNALDYPFFDNAPLDPYGRPVGAHRRLILRVSGNDSPNSRFRDAFIHALLRPIGIDDQRSQPAVQFINGEFWGIVNIRERIDRHYIAGRHLLDADDVDVLAARAALLVDDLDEPDDREAAAEAEFAALRDFTEAHDMSDPEKFAFVEAAMDMENFILYNAAHIYSDNRDWPHNNNRYWRKRTPDTRPGAPATHDGRWRWILNDLDFGFGLYGGANNANFNTLAHATNPNPSPGWDGTDRRFSTVMLRNLLENPSFRDRFINAFFDHMATSLRPERAHALIDAMNAEVAAVRDGEHRTRWGSMMSSNNHVDIMKEFATRRHTAMPNLIRSHFSLPPFPPAEMTFGVGAPGSGRLRINTIVVDAETPGLPDPHMPYPFVARYHPAVPIEVTALPADGFRFSHWVEFPEQNSPTLRISPRAGGSVTAVFVAAPTKQLLAYWHFNNPAQLAKPAMTRTGARLRFAATTESEFTDGGGNGFVGPNARGGEAAGRHLRINHPLGASLCLDLPTSGYRDPILRYETRRSGQGAGRQLIEFSPDGATFHAFAEIIVFDEAPVLHTFDFSGLPNVDDNPLFRVRIRFLQGEGGIAGNNRIDNLTLEGVASSEVVAARHSHYSAWVWDAFPDSAHRADPNLSGPFAAPFGDKLSNLVRYAFGIGAHESGEFRLPRIATPPGRLELLVPIDPKKTDISVRPEQSSDLETWSPLPLPVPIEEGTAPGIPLDPNNLFPVFHRVLVTPTEE